ncbi:MAG: flagellar basal-body rod protein FlgG [Alphaproteobacteria bacterium CG11_big_fil_rev_8_21_14_0_20_44_7]|nr:MAG: flagellar basal-body rod protein FlgG [Alphaproteobacteria bacterium CG11_big_fil_rev_8_21_14_0_20_44_7]
MRSLSIAATGMQAQQLNVEVISNNLANLTTTAYKMQRPEFQDLLYQEQRRVGGTSNEAGTIAPAGIQLGLGVRTGAVYRVQEQGTLKETGNQFDVAIRGKGYFVVELPNGVQGYTRAGAFQINQDGEIVTQQGNLVSPGITIPSDASRVNISATGVVEAFIDGQPDSQNLGQLELANFVNENGLRALGENLFEETTSSGDPLTAFPGDEGYGTILQGFLEDSNVDSVKEITNLIVAQRSYEMNSKVITTADEMMRTTSQLRS